MDANYVPIVFVKCALENITIQKIKNWISFVQIQWKYKIKEWKPDSNALIEFQEICLKEYQNCWKVNWIFKRFIIEQELIDCLIQWKILLFVIMPEPISWCGKN